MYNMYKKIITPRIGETDGLRYINNTAIADWFEVARNPIFKIFNPELELTYKKWNLLMVHSDFNYLEHLYFGFDVEIHTYITKIEKTSITVYHEAWQNGLLCANSNCILVYYDYIRQNSMEIPDDIKKHLQEHFITKKELKKMK